MKKTAQNTSFRDLLKLKNLETKKSFKENFPEAHQFLLEKGVELGKLRQHSAKIISAGALTGTLFLSPPTGVASLPTPSDIVQSLNEPLNKDANQIPQQELIESFKNLLPKEVRPLARDEEKRLEVVIKTC